jgi:beta-lactam-binding protein with PASTA domain
LYVDAVPQINEAFAVGTVFDQDPKAGVSVDQTSTVKYLFNPGATKKLVDNFVGGTLDDAKKKLAPLGLIVTVKPLESADKPPGTVLAQDPAPGPVPAGSTVTLTVAQAKNQVALPNLTGEDRDAAVSALTTLGVKPKVVEVASDTVEKGKVINTTPPQNTPVDKGSEVLINVSSGIGDAAVPRLIGLTVDEAFAKIQEAGFLVGAAGSKDVVLGTPEDGKVLSQNPPEGSKAPKKSTITVTIGKGIAPTTTTTTLPPTTTTTLPPTTTTTTIPAAPQFTIATTVSQTATPLAFGETAGMGHPGNYTWRIAITNTGNTTLTGITVAASQGDGGTCAKTTGFDLAPGIDMTYTCISTAVPAGVLVNNVTATIGASSAGTKPTPKSDGATATTA